LKKVLIISYYWPPSGGIGVLRSLKFVKYLRRFGWEPVVVIPKGADYPYYDEANLNDVPQGIEIIEIPIVEPFKMFKWLTSRKDTPLNNIVHVRDKKSIFDTLGIWVRGNFFIPDARCLWISPAVKYLLSFLQKNHIDAIFSDGPPHTNTVIATKLAARCNIPFLADFQDPWTQVDYYKLFKIGYFADKKHKALEQLTFRTANKITIASDTWKTELEKIGAKNVDVIYYGYDEDDFSELNPMVDTKFTICHSGLLGFDRNPINFFKVVSELMAEIEGFKQDVQIKLIGQIDVEVRNNIEKFGLNEIVNFFGVVPRRISLQEICNSWILLLPLNQAENAMGRIPGKFFEYIRAKRPIISIGPDHSDVHKIIENLNIGCNVDWDDFTSIKSFLTSQYVLFKSGTFESLNNNQPIDIFSNYHQTKILASYLDEIL
jgi:hypothetical protein